MQSPSAQRENLLETGQVDMIFATYSITDKRKEVVSFGGPYFVAGQDLLVAADDDSIKGPEDLEGKNLCSVTGSTSAQRIKDDYAAGTNLLEQPGYAECVTALTAGSVDAVTTDDIILAGLAAVPANKGKVKVVGNPFSEENYGVGIAKDSDKCEAINAAITKMVEDGTWDKLLTDNVGRFRVRGERGPEPADARRLQLTDPVPEASTSGLRDTHAQEGEPVDSGYLEQFLSLFDEFDVLAAFWVNIQLTVYAGIIGLVIGTVLATMRISPVPSLRWAGSAYVTVFRNTPLTIIMVFCVLGLWSQLDWTLSPDFTTNFFRFAVLALAVYHAAFFCEALRSGVNTVPIGQAEAARAIGLSFLPAARLVILPQAFRGSIAPLGNVLIALIKNSTVAAAAGVAEAAGLMKTMIEFRPDVILAIFLTFAFGFVLLVVPVGLLTTSLSRRLAVVR